MIITLYDGVRTEVKPDLIYDGSWEVVAEVVTTFRPGTRKESIPLFNLWDFKTQDYKPSPWGGISRCGDNTKGVWGLVLDFDGVKDDAGNIVKNTSIEEAHAMLRDYEYALYTTFRHHHDGILNKFRVVLPFKTMLPIEQFKAKRKGLLAMFPTADPASFSASQAFYLHSAWDSNLAVSYCNSGQFLDPALIENARSKPLVQVPRTIRTKPSEGYTDKVLDCLSTMSGMHYDDAMSLANAVKGSGGDVGDYKLLCNMVFDHASSHREKSDAFLRDEFSRAYDTVSKETVNNLLAKYGGTRLPVLCVR